MRSRLYIGYFSLPFYRWPKSPSILVYLFRTFSPIRASFHFSTPQHTFSFSWISFPLVHDICRSKTCPYILDHYLILRPRGRSFCCSSTIQYTIFGLSRHIFLNYLSTDYLVRESNSSWNLPNNSFGLWI